MTRHEHRLDTLEMRWKQPPSWKVWIAEETADGRLVEVGTGDPVQPGPADTVVVIGECPSGRTRGDQPPEMS